MRLVRRTTTAVLMLVIVLALAAALCGAALAAPVSRDAAPSVPAAQAVLDATFGWSEVLKTDPREGFLNGVDFVDASYGWAAGFGTLLATTDGGATWTQQGVPQGTGQLWAVSFSDRQHGWAAGEDVILGTTNGGATWTTQYTATGFTFTSLDCADATHAWAAGEDTDPYDGDDSLIIAHTTNGSTWSEQAAGVTGYLYGLDFVDETHGWIMVGSFALMEGIVLATTDGGSTWVKQHLGVFTKPFDVCFLDRNEGWALGYESNLLFHTTNGGSTWQSWKSGGLRRIHFTDSLHGFGAGLRFNDDFTIKDSGLYRTEDGGHTWTLDLARPRSEINNGMDFGDANHGCATGFQPGGYDPDTGVYTKTWSILRYVGAASDTTPPTTTVSGADAAWHNRPVTLTFAATDNSGGSGVAKTEYKLDTGAWTTGTSLTVSAPGSHPVSYRSTDATGNVEAAKSRTVKIDTGKPATRAYAASVRRGAKVKLAYRVDDPAPSCGRAKVTLKVYQGSRLKKTIAIKSTVACNLKKTHAWQCTLPKGRYTLKVYATDIAGNKQSKVGSNTLTVK